MRERAGRASCPAAAALLLLIAGARTAVAQSEQPAPPAFEPQLVFTIYGGLSEGGSLWRIPVQPLAAPNSAQDSVTIARNLRPGLVAGLVTTYFRSPNFGWSLDIGYFGVGSEQRCDSLVAYKPDSQNENSQTCTSANGLHVGTNVVGFLVGGTWRFAPEGRVQPFVRLTAGPGLLGNSSFVETSGFAVLGSPPGCSLGCTVSLLEDPDRKTITWVVNAAAGLSVYLAPGYRVRMELRDVVTQLPMVTGPRSALSGSNPPPMGSVVKHLPTFLFGVDVLLERRHGRRY